MELEDMIKAYLEKALAAESEPAPEPVVQKAQPEPEVVTKNELAAILDGFAKTVAEQVQKALPAEREPGTGRKGQVDKNAPTDEPDQLDAIVQKAQKNPDELDPEEKELIYRLSYEFMTAGLRY